MKRRRHSLEEEGEENPVETVRRLDRKFCGHCEELVSLKTYQYHRRLYYDQVSFFVGLASSLLTTWD